MSDVFGVGRRYGLRFAGVLVGLVAASGSAWAGGFEEPGIGVEAMGRGGAFTAKADDGSALEYNIAGFARQRGTRFLIEGKLTINDQTFQRAGNYPDMPSGTAWGGQAFPLVSNSASLSAAPLLAISTDFGYFERWTFVVGLTTPSADAANRQFPATVNGSWPAPQRYDMVNINLLVAYPMLAAAVRVTKWFDLALAVQMAYGNFDLKAVAFADIGCPGPESPQCDSNLEIKTTAFTATGVIGLMFHPLKNLHIGAQFRGPIKLDSSGTVSASTPPSTPNLTIDPGKATLPFRLPMVLRLGVRYAFMKGEREQGDIELDGTYEAWGTAQGVGDTLKVPILGPFSDVNATLEHYYKDTGSVRLGGAYNLWLKNSSTVVFRLGVFYDSAATDSKDTRLDFDTMDKIGYTVGLGYKIRGITINAAYNYVWSPDRVVTDGELRIINGTNGTSTGSNGQPLPVYNNGTYHASTQAVLLGLGFNFDELLRKKRVFHYDQPM